MFGSFGIGKYLAMREKASKTKRHTVTKDEFIKLATEAGMSEFNIKMSLMMAKAGGSTMVGDEMLTIENPDG